jgi:hypothetical protein
MHSPVHGSQTLILQSFDPETIRLSYAVQAISQSNAKRARGNDFTLNSIQAKPRSCPSNVRIRSPLVISQSIIFPSPLALTILSFCRPMALTGPSCPRSVLTHSKVFRSHTRIEASLELRSTNMSDADRRPEECYSPADNPLIIHTKIQDATIVPSKRCSHLGHNLLVAAPVRITSNF